METKFIADCNVGKLARLMRMMGYDTLFFRYIEDSRLVRIALAEGRILLTRDTQIMRRRVVSHGQVKMILLSHDDPKEQLRHVFKTLNLDCDSRGFTRCMECNESLLSRTREEVQEVVPPYVFKNHTDYMQCPSCHRVYWKGTHWERMAAEIRRLNEENGRESCLST